MSETSFCGHINQPTGPIRHAGLVRKSCSRKVPNRGDKCWQHKEKAAAPKAPVPGAATLLLKEGDAGWVEVGEVTKVTLPIIRPNILKRNLNPPCQCCGKQVARRKLSGKLRHPHKCPHGVTCPAGTILGTHTNGPRLPKLGGCFRCFRRYGLTAGKDDDDD